MISATMLNYKQLNYFWKVAKAGSIARAAEQLHLTPQTISGQINELERALGTDLFRRTGRRLELTPAGKLALSHAAEIFQIGNELEEMLRNRAGSGALPFRVGVSIGVPKSLSYRLLAPALILAEPVRLICHEDRLEALFAELAIHKLDLVIADQALPSSLGVKGYSHALGHCGIAFHAVTDLATRYRHDFPNSLQGAPLLVPGSSTSLRGSLGRWLSERRIQPQIVGEFDDTALMKAFGQAGVGIFPTPSVMREEVARQYGVEIVGQTEEISVEYFAISVERRLTHPAVVAISQAAHQSLFAGENHPRSI